MDPMEAAAQSGFIESGDRKAFIERMTQDPPRYPYLLEPHPSENRLQGDVFSEFPFAIVKSDGTPVVKPQTCLVLNNTCDLQPGRSQRCNVALATDYKQFADAITSGRTASQARGYLSSVEHNKIDDLLYLEGSPAFPNGLVVRLDLIATMPMDFFEERLEAGGRRASLSQDGFYFYLIKLTRFLARAESDDVNRRISA